MIDVVGKTTENYDSKRLNKAVKHAAAANRTPHGDAENFASRVVERVEQWLADKTEITSRELRLQTAAILADYNFDAAEYYLNEKMLF
jgi:transcriptional regulator NrdR family protein